MDVAITVLGGFSVAVGPIAIDGAEWRRRPAANLVKLLALQPGRRLHREQVMDLLWLDSGPEEAAPRLHKAAHYARRTLGDPDSLVLSGEFVALFPGRDVQVDAQEFEAAASSALEAGDPAAAGRAADGYPGSAAP
jgi:DNA-binding SARP family transcriptional activator